MRAFWMAVSSVKGGNGGRPIPKVPWVEVGSCCFSPDRLSLADHYGSGVTVGRSSLLTKMRRKLITAMGHGRPAPTRCLGSQEPRLRLSGVRFPLPARQCAYRGSTEP